MLWVLLPLQEVPAITQLPVWALEPPLPVPLYQELSH